VTDETARALLAGFVTGAAIAFATTFIGILALSRSGVWRRLPQHRRVPLPLMGVVLVNGMMLGWTALGLLLGAGFLRAESERPDGALLSTNWVFTTLVVGLTAAVLVASVFVRGRLEWPVWATAIIAVCGFGWMLPGLAG
jgi:hypothetical protein